MTAKSAEKEIGSVFDAHSFVLSAFFAVHMNHEEIGCEFPASVF